MKRFLLFLAALVAVLAVGQLPASATTTPLTGISHLVGGGAHTCARISSGRVRCWGDNAFDELGGGAPGNSARAVLVQNPAGTGPLSGVTQVAAFYRGACAVLTSHEVVCWGENGSGEHGIGTTAPQSPEPDYVLNPAGTGRLRNVRSLATSSGSTICAVLLDGQARCWGDNGNGQTGDGTTSSSRPFPVPVRSVSGTGRLTDIRSIELGTYHACALLTGGQVRCWGANGDGQLGDGTVNERHRPVVVRKPSGPGALAGVTSIGLGDTHSCAVLSSGQARCWGDNTEGKLGTGNTSERHRPTAVVNGAATANLGGVAAISGGVNHTCARLTNGQARCWGDDEYGQLGNGPGGDSVLPVTVLDGAGNAPLSPVSQLTTGDLHTCARIAGGGNCWGQDTSGQLGDDSFTGSKPLPVVVVRS